MYVQSMNREQMIRIGQGKNTHTEDLLKLYMYLYYITGAQQRIVEIEKGDALAIC